MTIRTFWTIFIKILGIWLILESLTVIPQGISSLMSLFFSSTYDSGADFVILAFLGILIALFLFMLRLFVFRTDWLIDKLHLEKGFQEERIDLNISLTMGMTIASLVVSGLILVDSIPELFRELFNFYQQKSIFRESPSAGWIFFYLIKSIIGYLLVTNSKQVAIYIARHSGKESSNMNN